MRTIKQQRGIGFLGILIILAMTAAIGLFGLKVLPLYIDNASVNKAMDDLPGLAGLGKQGKRGILKRLESQLYIDDVDTFDALTQAIVTKSKGKKERTWIVTADYEARANYAANIDIIVKFKKTVEVPR